MSYPTKKLGEVLDRGGVIPAKIKRDEYHESGKYPVVDQGENLIAGYIDDEQKLYRGDLPVIIFGDHTRILKYIDFPFAFGADGIKILRPQEILLPKFFYYVLILNPVANQGYKRHFSLLAQTKIPLPPLATQKQIVEQLDKIAEAQKLNDDLIKKTDELFQSLLHKELNPHTKKFGVGVNPAGKNWEEDKFVNCIKKNPLKIKGIPREKYQTSGKFPIIDQSDKFIVGYTDDENKVYKIGFPVIIFGDHTRIFKYIDFDFAIGADGTQIIIPDRKILIPKFFYFSMLNLKINNLGYSRHFKILKTKRLTIPPLEVQKQIVSKLSAVQDYKKQLLEQKTKLKELFDSTLANSMKA